VYEALRLKAHKALAEVVLRPLGRVNVICGQNNSGKSTVLEATTISEKRSAGRVFTESDAETLFQQTCHSMPWRDLNRRESRVYRQLLQSLIGPDRLWFEDDVGELISDIASQFKRQPNLREWAFNSEAVRRAFIGLFPAKPKCVLIPAKRRLELSRPIHAGEEPQPDGSGILNYLFFAKNQPAHSDDYKQYEELASAFEHISLGFHFDFFINRENNLDLRFAAPGAPWVPAVDCGLGLQDLLIVLTFAVQPDNTFMAIEEPENHLHPSMQRRLLFFLRDRTTKQILVTTHSNVFLNNAAVDRVFFTRFSGTVTVDDATSRASILDDLGYSVADNLVSDLVILVEGPSDVAVLEELLITYNLLQRFTVKLWPLGGDIMDQVDLSVISGQYETIALIDKDPGSSRVRRRFEERCQGLGIPIHRLERYAIENYFTPEAIREVFKGQVPDDWSTMNPRVKLDRQIGFSVKSRNRQLARLLTREDIESTDLGRFMHEVERRCVASASRSASG
jgi:hypothetical protein